MGPRGSLALALGLLLTGGAPHAQQAPAGADLFLAGPETYAPRYEPGGQQPPAGLIFPDTYIYEPRTDPRHRSTAAARQNLTSPESRVPNPESRIPSPGSGQLRLLVQPATAQIYVDGYFVGTVEDFPGADGPLVEPGVRRVELRADGYQPHTFDVRVLPDAIVTHRMVLAKAGASPASGADTRRAAAAVAPGTPSAQATPKTFYVIPGCYAGDSRPRVEQLPAGCDPAAVRVIVPDRR